MSEEGEQKSPTQEKKVPAAESGVKQTKTANKLAAIGIFLAKVVEKYGERSTEGFVELSKIALRLQVKALVRSTLVDLRHKSASDLPNLALLNVKLASSNPAFTGEKEKGQEIQRWFIGEFIGGLLSQAKGNDQLDASIRGFAWHFISTDANNFLIENGQKIDQEWLSDKMGPLVIAGKDSREIKRELSRLSKGDPEVVHKL